MKGILKLLYNAPSPILHQRYILLEGMLKWLCNPPSPILLQRKRLLKDILKWSGRRGMAYPVRISVLYWVGVGSPYANGGGGVGLHLCKRFLSLISIRIRHSLHSLHAVYLCIYTALEAGGQVHVFKQLREILQQASMTQTLQEMVR